MGGAACELHDNARQATHACKRSSLRPEAFFPSNHGSVMDPSSTFMSPTGGERAARQRGMATHTRARARERERETNRETRLRERMRGGRRERSRVEVGTPRARARFLDRCGLRGWRTLARTAGRTHERGCEQPRGGDVARGAARIFAQAVPALEASVAQGGALSNTSSAHTDASFSRGLVPVLTCSATTGRGSRTRSCAGRRSTGAGVGVGAGAGAGSGASAVAAEAPARPSTQVPSLYGSQTGTWPGSPTFLGTVFSGLAKLYKGYLLH
jgi:hypothetical protein